MKKFFTEFKEFIMRGNVVDLAVAVIVGGAFQAIVNSFINDLVMPFIGFITGGINFADQFIVLKVPEGVDLATVEAAKTAADATELGATVWAYGAFITAVINFIVMAFVVFLLVKAINKAQTIGKKKEEEDPTTKKCPFCCSEISIKATRCPHCTSEIPEEEEKAEE
ncbi:MAG: large conductance mechanosensitive channel protein MscL [Ruminococcus sp.]|nr:large conductance mechanosensitive channel protein MscL [Ruminococcus sp.]